MQRTPNLMILRLLDFGLLADAMLSSLFWGSCSIRRVGVVVGLVVVADVVGGEDDVVEAAVESLMT